MSLSKSTPMTSLSADIQCDRLERPHHRYRKTVMSKRQAQQAELPVCCNLFLHHFLDNSFFKKVSFRQGSVEEGDGIFDLDRFIHLELLGPNTSFITQ